MPSAGRSRRSPPPELPALPGGLLDWRERRHWSEDRAQCRYCPELTHLRDVHGRPAHKVCAEEAARAWTQNTPTERGNSCEQ